MAAHPMKLLGIENRNKILAFLRTHPGATYQEIARGVGMTTHGISSQMEKIKAEWRGDAARARAPTTTQLSMEDLWGPRP